MQLKQTWDKTPLQFYPRIKNRGMARINFGAFHIFFVGCGASTIRKGKVRYGLQTVVGKLVTGQTAAGSHSEALA